MIATDIAFREIKVGQELGIASHVEQEHNPTIYTVKAVNDRVMEVETSAGNNLALFIPADGCFHNLAIIGLPPVDNDGNEILPGAIIRHTPLAQHEHVVISVNNRGDYYSRYIEVAPLDKITDQPMRIHYGGSICSWRLFWQLVK